MTFIATVPRRAATGDTAEAYRKLDALAGGLTPNIMQAFSLRGSTMARAVRMWELSLWTGTAPRRERELLGALVSRLNSCAY